MYNKWVNKQDVFLKFTSVFMTVLSEIKTIVHGRSPVALKATTFSHQNHQGALPELWPINYTRDVLFIVVSYPGAACVNVTLY